MESGWNVWVPLVGEEWVESMGVACRCGCKEVYIYIYISSYYLSLLLLYIPVLFAAASLLFINFFGVYGASHSSLLIESTDSTIWYFIYFFRNVTSSKYCTCVIYIDFLILLIPTPLVSVLFCSSIPTFVIFVSMEHLTHPYL